MGRERTGRPRQIPESDGLRRRYQLFHRLAGAKLRLSGPVSFAGILRSRLRDRQVVRRYMYTIKETLEVATAIHGPNLTDGFRVVLGTGVPTKDGGIREKGVDALLVADLVYHAAVKNYDYALIVTADTDFVHGLRRVEDFGCRTGVLGVCCEVPLRLREAADETLVLSEHELFESGAVTKG